MSEDLKRSRDEEGRPGVAKKQRTGSVNPNTAGDKGGSGNGANANSASAGSVKKKIQPQSIDELEKLTLKELGKFSKEYFKAILKRWESDLLARPPEVKNSGLGRAATGQFKQVKSSMKSFFKGSKSGSIHIDVVGGISKIVLYLKQQEYVRAHDQYMLMAIGNSPWPIGVTAVGIHSRGGRERIGANKIAHIMDDEATRKSLNSVKRIMTYVQKLFPTAPSKMVFS